MPRVFVGNFDFEHELAAGRQQLTRDAQRRAAGLAAAWLAIADSSDIIWTPWGVPEFDAAEFETLRGPLPRFVSQASELPRGAEWELVPWGWTESMLSCGKSYGWNCPAPPLGVVKRVNSRRFRWQLEEELGVALGSSQALHSVADVVAHLTAHAETDGRWVLKSEFGMSGRERILGRGGELSLANRNWIEKRCQAGGVVYEPWLDRVAEAGLQWQIPPHGPPVLLAITPLLTDSAGTYRGSRIAGAEVEQHDWATAIETTWTVVQQLQKIGYWGPVGIDAMRYRSSDGSIQCRPLQDLNARFTMGRLACGLRRWVPAGAIADWLHDPGLVAMTAKADPAARAIQTTPHSHLVIRCPHFGESPAPGGCVGNGFPSRS